MVRALQRDHNTMGMHLKGFTAAQCCWDFVSGVELPSMMRSPPDILREDLKRDCLGVERPIT